MGAAQPEQLDPVLQGAQQPVCRGELRGILAPDIPELRERGEGIEGGA